MKAITCLIIIFHFLISVESKGQIDTSPSNKMTSLQELFDNIKSKEKDFSFPNLDDTLTVGTIDLGNLNEAEIGFGFTTPTYSTGNYSYPNPNYREEYSVPVLHAANQGGEITLANELHVNLRFKIRNWSNTPEITINNCIG